MPKSFLQALKEAGLYEDVAQNVNLDDIVRVTTDKMNRYLQNLRAIMNQKQLSPQSQVKLVTHVLNNVMQASGVKIDIPGQGYVRKLGMGPRNFDPKDKAHKSQVQFHHDTYMKQGLPDELARQKVKDDWRGLDDKNLRGIVADDWKQVVPIAMGMYRRIAKQFADEGIMSRRDKFIQALQWKFPKRYPKTPQGLTQAKTDATRIRNLMLDNRESEV